MYKRQGESRAYSDVQYIGEAVKIAKKYFKNIGIEIYPVNVDEYRYLHECGVDLSLIHISYGIFSSENAYPCTVT